MVKFYWVMKFLLIHAVSGIRIPMRSLTRTDSEETWAALKRLTMR